MRTEEKFSKVHANGTHDLLLHKFQKQAKLLDRLFSKKIITKEEFSTGLKNLKKPFLRKERKTKTENQKKIERNH